MRDRNTNEELSSTEFKFIEDRAVRDAVALQENAGLDVVTDGEMRRYAFFGHLPRRSRGSTSSAAGRSPSATARVTTAPLRGRWSSTSFDGADK
jgi:5-methyltetrahydropteroyltriglutamate--homocysteine methyltransferase